MTLSPAVVAAMSDEALLDLVQRATLSYFWDYGHPVSGMARERDNDAFGYSPDDTVTTGGTGFGVMALISAAASVPPVIYEVMAGNALWPTPKGWLIVLFIAIFPSFLSQIFFITTANSLHSIPLPLQDRMEIIKLPGYLETEKANIGKHFLLPKQIEAHGLTAKNLRLSDNALR